MLFRSTASRRADDNPNFIWPRPIEPDIYNAPTGKQLVDVRFQRGFMRGIYPSVMGGSGVKQRRLFFQFNPQTIERAVSMNEMVVNPLLQDPSQLFQPVPGTASFSFELLFNREAEVVSSMYASDVVSKKGKFVTQTATPVSSRYSTLDEYGSSTKWDDVASLGVLADMYVLDSIIGQSITPDMKGFLQEYWQTSSDVIQSYEGTTGTASAATFDKSGFEANISKTYGNTAFLSPLPVRIVFSSLFMVEGFVENTFVQFVKFSKEYVPTICKVTLTMRALYIGFAREDAYLTSSLKVAYADAQSAKKEEEARLGISSKVAYSGTNYQFKSPKLKIITQIGENSTYDNTFDGFTPYPGNPKFVAWWNMVMTTAAIVKEDILDLTGIVEHWANAGILKTVTDNSLTCDISGVLEIIQHIPQTGGSTVAVTLATLPMTYNKDTASAEFAMKTIKYPATNKASDKWTAKGPKTTPVITNLTGDIEFKMNFTRTVSNSGLTDSNVASFSYKASITDDTAWDNFSAGKQLFNFTSTVKTGKV